jgi:translation initiation factor IF-3
MDYGKWKYENKKKLVAARKKQVIIQTKEIQIRPRTDQHDLDTKLRHAREFILEGDKVKVNMRFMGREMAHQEQGHQLMSRVIAVMADIALVESTPKLEGKAMFLILAPDAVKVKDFLKAHPELKKPEPPEDDEA